MPATLHFVKFGFKPDNEILTFSKINCLFLRIKLCGQRKLSAESDDRRFRDLQ